MPLHDLSALQHFIPRRLSSDLWLYALCICVACSIALIIGLKRRQSQSLLAENSLLPTTSKDLNVVTGHNTCILYHFAPLGGMDSRKSPFMTSGQLAAKSDVEKSAGSTHQPKNETDTNDAEAQAATAETQPEETPTQIKKSPASEPLQEDAEPTWRRHSYPQDQAQPGLLRKESTHHEMEHVPDEFHAGIIWRRRTIVFEGKT
ncbi:hypothetical protein RBB50_005320 [Rhinocladiella similis]